MFSTISLLLSLLFSANAFMVPAVTQHRHVATALNLRADPERLVTTINSIEEYAAFLREDERMSVIK